MQRQVLSNRTVVSGHSMTSKYLETQRKRERSVRDGRGTILSIVSILSWPFPDSCLISYVLYSLKTADFIGS